MIKIGMTGGDGLVGSRIVELLKDDFTFVNFPQSEMNITDSKKVDQCIGETDFDLFLHLAAYTNVQGAEKEPDIAYSINRDGTKNIYEAVKKMNKNLIYVSTDFVFDGTNPPYYENSNPNPLGIYAKSKLEGEKILKDQAMIVRISYPYRSAHEAKKDFFRTFKSYLEQGKNLTMITDSLMTPTLIDDIANGLRYLIHNFTPEIFHLVGSESISPYNAAVTIAQQFNLDKSLIGKIKYSDYIKGKAALPQFADIKTKKNNFCKMRSLEEGLKEIKKNIQD